MTAAESEGDCRYQYQFGLARPLFNWGTDGPGWTLWSESMKRIKKEDFWPLAVNKEIYAGGFTNFLSIVEMKSLLV